MPSRLNREARKSLRDAFLLSLAAHGFSMLSLLTWTKNFSPESGVAPKILQVRVGEAAPISTSQSMPFTPTARSSQVSQTAVVSTHRLTSASAPAAEDGRVSPAATVSDPATSPSAVIAARPTSIPVARISEGAEASAASTVANANQQSRAVDFTDDLRAYRVGLAVTARRFRLYPALALEKNLTGRTEVEVVLQPWSPPRFQLKRTSGHDVLDQAALEMLRRASSSVDFPESLKERAISFVLPVEFVPPP